MYSFIMITYIISIIWCYSIVKNSDYNITMWIVIVIFTGPIAVVLLKIHKIIKKESSKKDWAVLILLLFVCYKIFNYY